jgi:DNA polymerase zeta
MGLQQFKPSSHWIQRVLIILQICRHCGGGDWLLESGIKCTSLACSVFYERRKVQRELQGLSAVAGDEGFYPKCMVEWF